MKTIFAMFSMVSLLGATFALADLSPAGPRIIESSRNSALRLENVCWDARDGKVRGMAYVNRGFSAPGLAHVHIYALNAAGKVLYAGCDTLNQQALVTLPQFPRSGAAFSALLPSGIARIQTIKVVAESGHSDCQPDDNRLLKFASR